MGKGWVLEDAGPAIPRKLAYCPSPKCNTRQSDKQREDAAALAGAGFKAGQKPYMLKNFNPNIQPHGEGRLQVINAIEVVRKVIDRREPDLIFMTGGTGVGKTHLAQGFISAGTDLGINAIYCPGTKFAREVRSFESSGSDGVGAFTAKLRQAEWLALDDVMASLHDPSGYVASEYHSLIDERYETGMLTLITTNVGEAGWEPIEAAFGDRLVSRVQDRNRAEFISLWKAKDMRQQVRG